MFIVIFLLKGGKGKSMWKKGMDSGHLRGGGGLMQPSRNQWHLEFEFRSKILQE